MAEQARIKWMMSLGDELGGPERARAMINAQGISLILKSIEVQYKRIVTYPDTVRPFSPALAPLLLQTPKLTKPPFTHSS